MNAEQIKNIPAEKFAFAGPDRRIHDEKLETKQIGYYRDAFNRFCRNKSSVVAAIIIFILLMYALFVPILGENNYTRALTDTTYLNYVKLLPNSHIFKWLG